MGGVALEEKGVTGVADAHRLLAGRQRHLIVGAAGAEDLTAGAAVVLREEEEEEEEEVVKRKR